ncbi:hypothetical protein NGR_c19320 [Sinorhizobium fredii NGR234]|uniref:DUF1176 domain-containing protein n=1 Tax=Sinorhizobium fredii (strain NBRC 101917 / NGR234) TaxID=394 RepID=C3ME26_SINFN|nr:hypothetical protein NGR_c19320 [Sinorhizobium fredii NGR234]
MRSFMKSAIALVLSASNVLAQEMAYFENWVAGCDNLRSCSAIGLPEEGVAEIGFVKIERGGAAKAAPLVTFGFYDVEPRTDRKLEVFLDDQEVGGFISEQDGVYTKAVLSGQNADAFFVALGKARQLRISRSDKNGRALARVVIAVAGSVPSLRFVDDRQMRGGTVTALVNKGWQPASRVPAVPEAPLVAAKPIQIVEDSPPPASTADATKDADILPARMAWSRSLPASRQGRHYGASAIGQPPTISATRSLSSRRGRSPRSSSKTTAAVTVASKMAFRC